MNTYSSDGHQYRHGGPGEVLGGETGLTTEAGSTATLPSHSKDLGHLSERRVLVLGLPRSGKSSIMAVVFENMMPYDTLGMIPTQTCLEHHLSNTGITVYDFPGLDDYSDTYYTNVVDPRFYEGETTSLIYVVDSQGDIHSSLATFSSIVRIAQSRNPQLSITIFIHKVDGLSEELKDDIQQVIQQRVMKSMGFEGLDTTYLRFMLTTIFDESIKEAISRVVQRLVPKFRTLESILNSFCTKSMLEKVFLLDQRSKVYLSTDLSPTETQQYAFSCQTIAAMQTLTQQFTALIEPPEGLGQQVMFGLSGDTKIYIHQIDANLALLCIGSSQVFRQRSLVEFNAAKVARAIRQILPYS
ncbi:GTP-binding protein gtr2 [Coemansia sp. Benny D115]|nr:GTP-binding protein gtr2 [Coemansia sp. Benny D115]